MAKISWAGRRAWVPLLVSMLACTLSLGAGATTHAKVQTKAQTKAPAKGHAKPHAAVQPVCKPIKKKGHKGNQPCSHKATHAAAVQQGDLSRITASPTGQLPTLADASSNPRSTCLDALASSRASQHIAAKVPFLMDQAPTSDVLANRGHPDKTEKMELASVIAGHDLCRDMSSAWQHETYSPEVVGLQDAKWHETKAILESLQAGKLSYGEAARAIDANEQAYQSKLAALPGAAVETPAPAKAQVP
jgi:hypothetical protein